MYVQARPSRSGLLGRAAPVAFPQGVAPRPDRPAVLLTTPRPSMATAAHPSRRRRRRARVGSGWSNHGGLPAPNLARERLAEYPCLG